MSVCGEYPSDKLKVPLSVQDTSETSVSDTDSSLATIAGLTYTENSPIHGIIFKKNHTAEGQCLETGKNPSCKS